MILLKKSSRYRYPPSLKLTANASEKRPIVPNEKGNDHLPLASFSDKLHWKKLKNWKGWRWSQSVGCKKHRGYKVGPGSRYKWSYGAPIKLFFFTRVTHLCLAIYRRPHKPTYNDRAWYLGHFLFDPCSIKYHTIVNLAKKMLEEIQLFRFESSNCSLAEAWKKKLQVYMNVNSESSSLNSFGPEGFQKLNPRDEKLTRKIDPWSPARPPVWSSQVSRSMFPPQTAAKPQRLPRFGVSPVQPLTRKTFRCPGKTLHTHPLMLIDRWGPPRAMLKLFYLEVILFIPGNLGTPNNQFKLDVWWNNHFLCNDWESSNWNNHF